MVSKKSKQIKERALKMGAKVRDIIKERNLFLIEYKGKKIPVEVSFSINRNSYIGIQTTKSKDITHLLLVEAGLSTPKAAFFYHQEEDKQIINKIKDLTPPLLIKHLEGSCSRDVSPNLKSTEEALRIISGNMNKKSRLMVQEMVFGREYRLLVLDDKIIGALEMIPPCVYGDGLTNVSNLIKAKEKKIRKKINLSHALEELLREQGLKITSVPNKGMRINLGYYSELTAGGESVDVLNSVHDDFNTIGKLVSVATGKYLCALDIITDDIARSLKGQKYHILEVNGRPDLTIHYNPTYGEPQDVISDIIKFIANRDF